MTDSKQALLAAAVAVIVGLFGYIVHLQGQVSSLQQQRAAVPPAPAVVPRAQAPAAAPVAPAAPAAVANPRVLSAEQRTLLIEKLGGPNSSLANPVWFATAPNNPEAAAFQKQLSEAFEAAGWKVQGNVPVPFPIKPGLFVFAADEQPPNYVQNAVSALEDLDFTVTAGFGYREFYNAKKAENPSWIGFQLAPDQSYVLVVGRKPDDKVPPTPSSDT